MLSVISTGQIEKQNLTTRNLIKRTHGGTSLGSDMAGRNATETSSFLKNSTIQSELRNKGNLSKSIQNAVSFVQTQQSKIEMLNDIYNRMTELAGQASDPFLDGQLRKQYATEFQALREESSNIGKETFQGKALFDSYVNPLDADFEVSGWDGLNKNIIVLEETTRTMAGTIMSFDEGQVLDTFGISQNNSQLRAEDPNNPRDRPLSSSDINKASGNWMWFNISDRGITWEFASEDSNSGGNQETSHQVQVGDGSSLNLTLVGVGQSLENSNLDSANAAVEALQLLENEMASISVQMGTIGSNLSKLKFASAHIENQIMAADSFENSILDEARIDKQIESAKSGIMLKSSSSLFATAISTTKNILNLLF